MQDQHVATHEPEVLCRQSGPRESHSIPGRSTQGAGKFHQDPLTDSTPLRLLTLLTFGTIQHDIPDLFPNNCDIKFSCKSQEFLS